MRMKKLIIYSILIFCVLSLTSCSVNASGVELEGINVIFALPINMWFWFWDIFTPTFWDFIGTIWYTMPPAIVWLAGPIAYILGVLLYVAIMICALALLLIICILIGIIYFLLAILVGVFSGFSS